jgi:alkaline phosphatase
MVRIYKLLFLSIAVIFIISCNPERNKALSEKRETKNVILIIGDGMGLPHIYAAMSASENPLNFEQFGISGLQKTYSSNAYITDSGAAGTAIATGSKTLNGAIGVDENGSMLKSILEIAEEQGLATGMVVSSSVTHATPASFIAHQSSRSSYEDIAMDFLKTDIDLFIGGGYDHFARRSDSLNLADSLRAKGYEVLTSMDMVVGSGAEKLAGLVYQLQPPYRLKGRGDMLPVATKKAIEILSRNKKGFFLMIEGSQIDWAAHANAADTLIDETLDLDNVIGIALDFAKNDGNTLVVVTADHETGGVTITNGNMDTKEVTLAFSTTGHSAILVPVFAFGPGSENFSGIYDNTDLNRKLLTSYNFSKIK